MADLPNDENNNQPIDDGIDEVLESIISFNEDSIEAVKDLNEAVNFFADLSEKIGTTPDVEDASTKRNQEEAKIDYGLTIDQVTEATVEAQDKKIKKEMSSLEKTSSMLKTILIISMRFIFTMLKKLKTKGMRPLSKFLKKFVTLIYLRSLMTTTKKKQNPKIRKKQKKKHLLINLMLLLVNYQVYQKI